jgi:intracellular multiplication protein IcmL
MVEEVQQQQTVELRDDFYRDGFGKIVFVMLSIVLAILILVMLSLFLYLDKPKPVVFAMSEGWRIQPEVPVNQPYLPTPIILQWIGDILPRVFTYDFINYDEELEHSSQYFTTEGWDNFANELNTYVNYNNVQAYKLFVNARPAGAPFILNQGLLSGRYAWWVQMPLEIVASGNQNAKRTVTFQILVVRVSTLNNLIGISIDKVVELKKSS